jgi:hypothetical protein
MKVRKLYSAFYALAALLFLLWVLPKAQADDDLFWYAYPMPQAYLYVRDPLRYALWSAHYGDRQARVPIGYPIYVPLVSTHDRSRLRRRECEIRILAGHRQ